MAECASKRPCKYGSSCYRKNPDHLREFSHPEKRSTQDDQDSGEAKRLCLDLEVAGAVSSPSPAAANSCSDQPAAIPAAAASQDDDGDQQPESPIDLQSNLRNKFLVDMPDDFYSFLEFCKSLNADQPQDALTSCQLVLSGACRVALGMTRGDARFRSRRFCLTYCRHYYDPPEFQTVINGDPSTGYHLGYWRHSPDQRPCVVMANNSQLNNQFTELGDNLFAAVNHYLTQHLATSDATSDATIGGIQTALQQWSRQHNFSLDARKQRRRAVVARSLQGCGLVVPYDHKTQLGYRDLGESAASMKRILKVIVAASDGDSAEQFARAFGPLQELITNVHFANDEGDPGAGLELGHNVFGFGGECLHKTAKQLLCVAYQLLERPAFADILLAHLQDRRKDVPSL